MSDQLKFNIINTNQTQISLYSNFAQFESSPIDNEHFSMV